MRQPSPELRAFDRAVGPAAKWSSPSVAADFRAAVVFAAVFARGVVFLAAVVFVRRWLRFAAARWLPRRGARRFGAGPAARRSASSSIARCSVIDSGASPLRSDALVSPSVTYGPNRPSRSTIGLPLAVSSPSSRSGGAAAARAARPRCLGWANSSLAWSSVSVNSCSSDSSDRLSVPFLAYGP